MYKRAVTFHFNKSFPPNLESWLQNLREKYFYPPIRNMRTVNAAKYSAIRFWQSTLRLK